MVESLSVLSLCMFKTVRLLNRSWFVLERSHAFSLRAVEKDLSPTALVAGFTHGRNFGHLSPHAVAALPNL